MTQADTAQPRLKIVRIIARLNIGGPAIHVTLLTEALSAPPYNHDCELVVGAVGAAEGDMRYFAEARGVQPITLPELGREVHPTRDLVTIWKVFRLLRRLRPDVVHTHTMKAGFVGRIAARLAGVPVIVHTAHGHSFHGYWGTLKTRLFLNLERLAAWHGDRLATLTPGLRDDLVDNYRVTRPEKAVVLPLGLDLARFAATPRHQGGFRAAHGIAPDAPLVGIVGRLVPIKNHSLFLRAAARVRAALPNARFAIIGDGETRAQVEAEAEALGLADAVTFTGWLHDLAPAYSDLDLVVISSLNEGTPVSLIEALAGGCPVVSTAVGGVPDLLEDGRLGTLVSSGDETALAEAMLAALRRPAETASTRADVIRQHIVERYAIARLARDLDALYRAVLSEKRRP